MNILVSFLVFGVIVFFHELGHFAIAKMVGVKVYEFAIGMGPKLFSYRGYETEYTIRALPLGGYVRMEGEEESSDDPKSFSNKSVLERISIILAGPVMNFVLAVILFMIIFINTGIPTTIVKDTIQNLPAQQAGIMPGDRIVEINNSKVKTWDDVVKEINFSEGKQINIKVERDKSLYTYIVKPVQEEGRIIIGILPKQERNILLSFKYSVYRVYYILSDMLNFLFRTITGKASATEVTGPVGILNLVGQAAQVGMLNVIYLASIISINLGLLNLLPIPALDGSRILFLIVEGIRGKKISPERENTVHLIGFALLMALTIFITYKDILRIIK
ncbi:regulator of sigma E protease [Alkalithermobacter thermoalcaliphilus JW-YL-7 = DSM 7308]|uniref:Zinc metalloprotease n=1 Tax=Alkalithermobacter thermoalcaliphilus JW-YL-7 = DSM 7308 TaxID=1121328 RepID=A0A150FQB1_CLOPD|nr:membrane-associated zinc metalloprotease [[Clostridium] paradoxum JW-YL-7 = DSM 7308]SHK59785.1 regulator of sigma E protease [[Clostridium] paradoxum JW-YL-7 = DSM 7308]